MKKEKKKTSNLAKRLAREKKKNKKLEKEVYRLTKEKYMARFQKHVEEFSDSDYGCMMNIICDMLYLFENKYTKDSCVAYDPKDPISQSKQIKESLKKCKRLARSWEEQDFVKFGDPWEDEQNFMKEFFSTIAENITLWWD